MQIRMKENKNDILCRIIVYELQQEKKTGNLHGNSPEEEYQDYTQRYLNDAGYWKTLQQKYPELMRLSEQVSRQREACLCEIYQHLEQDKEAICKSLCGGRSFQNIQELDWQAGDTHNFGRRTVRVLLDNDVTIYYKPHSIHKNVLYQQAFRNLSDAYQLSVPEYRALERDGYGWEAEIRHCPCNTVEEVQRYYLRMGLHLFLSYALSASDLHGENIIACGEYPVIIDYEAFPGYAMIDSGRDSVLCTGILPMPIWGKEDAAIINALNSGEKIYTPFRMPVIKNEGRSDIYIAHEPIEIQLKGCEVKYQEKIINPSDYVEELCEGFSFAYYYFLQNTELQKLLETFFNGRFRVVLRHTQQYAMYRFTSLHPSVGRHREDRRKLLEVLYEEHMSDQTKRLHDYEIEALMRMDIPYFELEGKSRSLYDGDGGEYPNYLPMPPYEAWRKKRGQLGRDDLVRQSALIRLSVALLQKKQLKRLSETHILPVEERQTLLKMYIHRIRDWLCQTAVITESGISWTGPHFLKNERWRIVPLGSSLYDGTAGIAVFLTAYVKEYPEQRTKKLQKMLCSQLFRYTDRLVEGATNGDGTIGVWEGDGSLAAAYLLLYRITEEKAYLTYARKHFLYIEKHCRESVFMDYLNGAAGAIVLAEELYQITGEDYYKEIALQLEKKLWENATPMESGVGWHCGGGRPLAGLAHGSSGMLMAYASLLKLKFCQEYIGKVQCIIDYEDSLYSEQQGNWLDYRSQEKPRMMNAWCHGAPGILLARLKLAEVMADDLRIRSDIQRAAKALFTQEAGAHICLCHGIAGNLMIMARFLGSEYVKRERDAVQEQYLTRFDALFSELLLHMEVYEKKLAYEACNPALMNGITGVGAAMLWLYQGESRRKNKGK